MTIRDLARAYRSAQDAMIETEPGTPESEARKAKTTDAQKEYFFAAQQIRAKLARIVPVKVVYARPGEAQLRQRGGFHLEVGGAVADGRFSRQAGDILCKAGPWWAREDKPDASPGCLACLEWAERLIECLPRHAERSSS